MTRKQQIFIKEYVLTRNGAESARKAGYSVKNADKIAYNLLQKVEISRAIEAEFERIAETYKPREANIYFGINAIAENGRVEANRLRAYELQGKVIGMFKEATVQVNLLQNIDASKQAKARKLLRARGLQSPSK